MSPSRPDRPDHPDQGWKPNNRPQSTIALNFMTELDDLFRLDGGIDVLDKNVHQKKQAVTTHTQELEAIEARLRETEERLKEARNSPPRPNAGQPSANPYHAQHPTAATPPKPVLPAPARSDNTADYVMVHPDEREPAKP